MIVSVVLTLSIAAAADAAVLGDRIVEQARSRLGRKVGGGQCSDLVFDVYQAAGASPFDHSEARADLADARPGDVLDFQGAEFRGRTGRGKRTYWYRFEQHAAIVASVRWKGDALLLRVLHQNVGREKTEPERRERVTEQTLDLADLVDGTITAYRPRRHALEAFRGLLPSDDADDGAREQQ